MPAPIQDGSLFAQVVLPGVSPSDRHSLPFLYTSEAVQSTTLLHTDRDGGIAITTDGEQIWVLEEKRWLAQLDFGLL